MRCLRTIRDKYEEQRERAGSLEPGPDDGPTYTRAYRDALAWALDVLEEEFDAEEYWE